MQRFATFTVLVGTAGFLACSEPTADVLPPQPEAEPQALGAFSIAFVSDRDGYPRIYLAHPGGAVRPLAGGEAPAWSPDSRQIAFHSWDSSAGGSPAVYVINKDGTGRRWLAEGQDPAWSRDGLIAFDGDGGIYVVDAEGRSPPRMVLGDDSELPRPDWFDPEGFDGGWVGLPAWSPDGERIAFVRFDGFRWDWGYTENAYAMNADGSELRFLGGLCEVDPPGERALPCRTTTPFWSRTGALTVVTERWTHGGSEPALAILGDAGWEDREILYTGLPGHRLFSPHWVPSGDIVLSSFPPGQKDASRTRIFLLTLATGALRQLIPDVASPWTYGDSDPVWWFDADDGSGRGPWDY